MNPGFLKQEMEAKIQLFDSSDNLTNLMVSVMCDLSHRIGQQQEDSLNPLKLPFPYLQEERERERDF